MENKLIVPQDVYNRIEADALAWSENQYGHDDVNKDYLEGALHEAMIAQAEYVRLKAQPGPRWVKASERLPVKKHVVAKMFVSHLGKEVVGTASSTTGEMICFDWGVSSVCLRIGHEELTNLQWLDESGQSKEGISEDEWDSERIIGRVRERFKELEAKQWDWRSFYNGWLEGRSDMLQQIKGWGKYKAEEGNKEREVAFAEWCANNYQWEYGPTSDEYQWLEANNFYTTAELYDIFNQQKEK